MIVVTFALPAESSAFIRLLKNVRYEATVVRGELSHQTSNIKHQTSNVCVLHTGVGATKCAERLGNFLREETPELLIASGFCGGTNDDLHPGDLVIGDNGSDLSRQVRAALPGTAIGKIYSADRVIDPAADRYEIGRKHGAIAIDMETATIARLCGEKSIPLLTLRVVSDSPAAPFPMPPSVLFDTEKQRTNFLRLFSYIARNPASAIHLMRFARQIACAKTKLADALAAVIAAL